LAVITREAGAEEVGADEGASAEGDARAVAGQETVSDADAGAAGGEAMSEGDTKASVCVVFSVSGEGRDEGGVTS